MALVAGMREGAEVVYGAAECRRCSTEMLEELGFPRGLMAPLEKLEECGRVRETGFVWMKRDGPTEHYFKATKTRVQYEREVTAYIEKGRMKRVTGVRCKQLMVWIPIVEMSTASQGTKVYFKSAVGVGKAYPASAFSEEEEDEYK